MTENPFIIYKASAGAGKTHTLVREYLKMAFSLGEGRLAEGIRSILAITFTNKAAAEMKERILDELHTMASQPIDPDGNGMGSDLLRELAPAIDADKLSRMAAKLYKTILHRFSDLSVSTIDSFTHRIVRTFAHDFGQPMNFDVTLDAKELIRQSVAQLMSLAGTEKQEELTEVLRAFAESEMEEDNNYDVERLLTELAEQLFNEDIGDHLKQLSELTLSDFREIHRDYTASLRTCETQLKNCGSDAITTLHAAGLDVSVCHQGVKGFYGYFNKLAEGIFGDPGKYTVTAFEDNKFTGAKCPAPLRAAAEAIAPKLHAIYDNVQQLLVRRNTYLVLLRKIYAVALLGEIDRQMRLYTRDNDMVHLSDFNRMINRMVEDDDNPAPFIFERLGNRYRHFLIDEFQDTSIMQWHNMVPLLENGVSQRLESLVVGDGKQSIYRFRQGDVTQFVRLPYVDGMRHHGRTLPLKGNYSVCGIDSNHRSTQAVVDFNNSLFCFLARNVYSDNPVVQDIYIGRTDDGNLKEVGHEELLQKKVKKAEGYVELAFVTKGETETDGFENVKDAIYERVGRTIAMLHNERGYAYGDMAVLTRTNSEIAAVSSYLTQHWPEVRQTSTESFYLSKSQAVMSIIATLRLLVDRDDRVAQTDLRLRLQALGLKGEPDIDYIATMNLYDACEEIVRELHLDSIDNLYVASLLNRVATFSARHKQEPKQFLEWFDSQKSLSAAASDDVDAVQLLTIHKSKGLGKPVVICPLFFRSDHPAKLWVEPPQEVGHASKQLPATIVPLKADSRTLFEPQRHEEQLMNEVDELNIMYVAFTRAKEQLYIFCPDPADIKKPIEHDRRYPTLLKAFAPNGYCVGDSSFCHIVKKSTEHKTVETVHQLSFSDWSERVSIASPQEKSIVPLLEDRRRFGIYAHDLLATVQHADDVEQAIARFADSRQLTEHEKEELGALARRVVSDPQTACFFDPRYEAKNESDLVDGGRRCRPDRVVLTPTETWVVDFKTGTPLQEHTTQVQTYCSALHAMGYPNVSGHLLYLSPDKNLTIHHINDTL